MTNQIYPCLWFDGQAKAAAEFYCSIFKNSKITTDTPMVVNFELNGKKFMGFAVKSLEDGIVHPTINLETPDPECDLDYVPGQARQINPQVVLSNSFGLGGQNACLVLGRYDTK